MKSFEQRKKEYLKKINKNQDIKYLMLASFFEQDDSLQRMELHFNPKNEMELDIAESTYQLINDGQELKDRVMNYDVKRIPTEDNEFYKLMINALNLTKTEDTIKEYESYLRNLTPIQTANIFYGMIVGYMLDYDDTSVVNYIAENTGYNITNEEDFIIFNSKLESAKLRLPGTTYDEKYSEEYKEMVNEFHKLCNPEKSMKLTK